MTLVKSFKTGYEFSKLPYPHTTMDSVFRKLPLVEVLPSTDSSVVRNGCGQLVTPHTNGTALPTITTPAMAPRSSSTTYAAQAGASVRPLPQLGTLGPAAILLNDHDLRVDCLLPAKSVAASEIQYQKSREGKRYCNKFHLCGSCEGNCGYLHDPLHPAEKLVKRHFLRGEKCKKGGQCREPKCFYGHHCDCPQTKKCAFPPSLHNIDVSTWRIVVYPDGC